VGRLLVIVAGPPPCSPTIWVAETKDDRPDALVRQGNEPTIAAVAKRSLTRVNRGGRFR
jgi:hypothetical protein